MSLLRLLGKERRQRKECQEGGRETGRETAKRIERCLWRCGYTSITSFNLNSSRTITLVLFYKYNDNFIVSLPFARSPVGNLSRGRVSYSTSCELSDSFATMDCTMLLSPDDNVDAGKLYSFALRIVRRPRSLRLSDSTDSSVDGASNFRQTESTLESDTVNVTVRIQERLLTSA